MSALNEGFETIEKTLASLLECIDVLKKLHKSNEFRITKLERRVEKLEESSATITEES